MATWKTRGLRGSLLEDLINRTNEKYRETGLALIQKIPTPITPVQIDKESVDYIGAVQGIPVCFDAKECAEATFSLQNIHPHQVQFMREFEAQDGVAFFLIFFTRENLFYYLPFRHFLPFWERAQAGGRRSFRLDELDMTYVIPDEQGLMVPYLDMVNKDLLERE